VDFDLAFAPERVNPGDPTSGSAEVPRLVGGTTPQATERAAVLLEHVNTRVVRLSSPDHAELAKLVENTFRNVNIALVNELAMLCERMELDVWEVLEAAGTKPFGFMRFNPGPGVGGHCIPVDPRYLSWRAREFDFATRFIDLSSEVNLAMPRHVADLVGDALNEVGRPLNGARVGILGVAFKPDVKDARNSPAADVIAQLRGRMAVVDFHDPHVHRFTDGRGTTSDGVALDTLLAESDVVCIVTAHRAIDWAHVFATAPLIVDTVNASAGHQAAGAVLRLGAGWRSRVAEPELAPTITLEDVRAAIAAAAEILGQPIDGRSRRAIRRGYLQGERGHVSLREAVPAFRDELPTRS
jgi:UDP-N-acetyl-D-glucosamine dehydrogenase